MPSPSPQLPPPAAPSKKQLENAMAHRPPPPDRAHYVQQIMGKIVGGLTLDLAGVQEQNGWLMREVEEVQGHYNRAVERIRELEAQAVSLTGELQEARSKIPPEPLVEAAE